MVLTSNATRNYLRIIVQHTLAFYVAVKKKREWIYFIEIIDDILRFSNQTLFPLLRYHCVSNGIENILRYHCVSNGIENILQYHCVSNGIAIWQIEFEFNITIWGMVVWIHLCYKAFILYFLFLFGRLQTNLTFFFVTYYFNTIFVSIFFLFFFS